MFIRWSDIPSAVLSSFDEYHLPQPALIGSVVDDNHFSSKQTSLNELVIIADEAPELLDLADELSRLNRNQIIQVTHGMGLAEVVDKAKHLEPLDSFDRIHLIGHGTPGKFTIGDDIIDHKNIKFNQKSLS